jgi:hypothetical protein
VPGSGGGTPETATLRPLASTSYRRRVRLYRYRLHDTTGDDLGTVEHPAPNVEPGEALMPITTGPGGAGARRLIA